MKKLLKNIKNYSKNLIKFIKSTLNLWVLPGHFYSPIPNLKEIKQNKDKIFNYNKKTFPAIELNADAQLTLLNDFSQYKKDIPWENEQNLNLRFNYKNNYFGKTDADILHYFIRKTQPHRIIEVGSGFSSAVALDTNELFFQNKINLTFIEPYPQRLKGLLRKKDNVEIIQKKLQDIPLEIFKELSENDILFIDSTHVTKTGSDVNYIFFEILPCLKQGVYIHFHDIFYPFEYPESWVYEARAWNELYLLRAFLQYNNNFEIIFFNSYMGKLYKEKLETEFNLNDTGGSFWMRKK